MDVKEFNADGVERRGQSRVAEKKWLAAYSFSRKKFGKKKNTKIFSKTFFL